MVRSVLKYPHPLLKQPTLKVDVIDSEILKLVQDMWDTMYAEEGVGLAANQIGEPLRIMVIDTTPKRESPPVKLVLINPQLIEAEGHITYREGCLSFPGLSVEVTRYSKVRFRALDLSGEEKEYQLEGFPAIVFQHELDHLNGITFIDRLSGLRRRLALEKYGKLQRQTIRGEAD
ncbi:peptide deformylase [Thermocrinis albus DSM 14484]|uniref:Peptide deformylase n=1 Tax=Thermocrinis albus (strain DSM 14484 / JCM 11386 / HI 11/12) TaxID=638303 RepID=D3SLL9_THEAH|nr:peptide deformylase [Thermocrinis albus]ADC89649.1 peptide deformylase [Thermocrinis albus DSM 14484]